ncbi:hypothetical protein [Nonomuraea diastatica]|uniref:Uncharacterized protein n=1 Tax=Nonomuraea diastatica TaxID=1848329 RepID=A0A4R4VGU6_9ACTN|nr:hypothetical protein [Nonomuraea diastatica]TDD04848.1 hypothetical protein E1294_49900 [Nonomuraea diastatica]
MNQHTSAPRRTRLRRLAVAAVTGALLATGTAAPVVLAAAPASASARDICKAAVREHDFYRTKAMELREDAHDATGSKRRDLLRRAKECDNIANQIQKKYSHCF